MPTYTSCHDSKTTRIRSGVDALMPRENLQKWAKNSASRSASSTHHVVGVPTEASGLRINELTVRSAAAYPRTVRTLARVGGAGRSAAALAAVEEGCTGGVKYAAVSICLRTGGRHHACGYRVSTCGLGRLPAHGVILHRTKRGFTSDAYRRARPRLEAGRISHDDIDRVGAARRIGVGEGG